MTFIQVLGFGILCIVFIYIAVRVGASAWFKSVQDHLRTIRGIYKQGKD